MAAFGTVAQVVIPRNRATGESRGYGFVQFVEEEGAFFVVLAASACVR